MRRQYKKYALWGAAFAALITLGAATAAFTAGAAPFGAQATTTIVSTVTTGSTTVVTTITTTTPDSTSTGTTGSSSSSSTSTDTTGSTTTTTKSGGGSGAGGGGAAPAATPQKANPSFTRQPRDPAGARAWVVLQSLPPAGPGGGHPTA